MRGRKGAAVRTAVLVVGAMGVSVATSVYLARANPGQATAPALAFVGTLTRDGQAMAGPQVLRFRFRKGGSEVCAPEVDSGPIDPATGSFHALVPLGGCPGDLFDGSDVTFDVEVSGAVVARDSPVSAVPYAKYADQVGFPDCPVGYTRAADANYVVCKKGPAGEEDEVVRVGVGASAFWIDRYEAVLIRTADGTRVEDPANFPDLPQTGQWLGTVAPARAVSKRGEMPTESITWFQASEACRASGKTLPAGDEWLAAAKGTPDPGVSAGDSLGRCNTFSPSTRSTGISQPTANVSCVSSWGAEDMIGNLWEMTTEWDTGAGIVSGPAGQQEVWPDAGVPGDPEGYRDDRAWNVHSETHRIPGDQTVLLGPAVIIRGGERNGTYAGIFAFQLESSPSHATARTGFRCIIRR